MSWSQSISNFRQGLRFDLDANVLPLGAAVACENLRLDKGSAYLRGGLARKWQVPVSSLGVKQFAEYAYFGSTPKYGLFSQTGAVLNWWNGDTDTYTPITFTSCTLAAGDFVRLAQFRQWEFLIDSSNPQGVQYASGLSGFGNFNTVGYQDLVGANKPTSPAVTIETTGTSTVTITNADFGTGTLANWQLPSGAGTVTVVGGASSGYTYAAKLSQGHALSQQFSVIPGCAFACYFAGGAKGVASLTIESGSQTGTILGTVAVDNIMGYTVYSMVGTIPSDCNSVQLYFLANDGSSVLFVTGCSMSETVPAGTIPTGYYQVGLSIARLALDGTTYVEGDLVMNFVTVTLGDYIQIVYTEDTGLTANDLIYIYLTAQGSLTTLYRVSVSNCQGSTGATDTITLSDPADTTNDFQYVNQVMRPPAGITLLYAWNNRMYYAVGGELYVSNLNSPDVVPQSLTSAATANLGGFVPIGQVGNIVALCGYGSCLYVFAQHGLWRLVGDPSSADFAIEQITLERYALSQEGVCNCEGNLLVWTELNSLWAFNGNNLFEIGTPIAGEWKAIAETGASLVYDGTTRQLLLQVPSEGILNAVIYVCDLSEPIGTLEEDPTTPLYGWTAYTGMPGGVLHRLDFAPVPGVYGSDAYGRDGTVSGIFLLNSTQQVDDSHASTSGAAIPYLWESGMLYGLQGGGKLWKGLSEVDLLLSPSAPLLGQLAVYLDNGATALLTKTLNRVYLQSGGQYQWIPQPVKDFLGYQISIAGSTSTGGELLAITCIGDGRGALR